MELNSSAFKLLNETLNYLNPEVVGKITNVVRNKNNKFVFHVTLQGCEEINNDDIDLALSSGDIIPLSDVQPGSLLGCFHPEKKKWMRCYVLSILHQQVNVALCETGEITITKAKNLKAIPFKYISIPVITFEAEVKSVCPYSELRHLMENFKNYTIFFEPFKNKLYTETCKKMKLIYENVTIDFIIQKWDPLNCKNTNDTNTLIKNGSAVIIAREEIFDWRHIFVKCVDQYVNICKELQIFCKNASNIQTVPVVGDIIAVKCVDSFYRCKIIDLLDDSHFSLYLIDAGYEMSASIDCLIDLPETLKKVPSTVCLIGLKSITLKPWTPEASSYITTLFKNSTTMILEYPDYDPFALDSVTLTIINNNEDVNEYLKELLKFVEDPQNDDVHTDLNSVHGFNTSIKLQCDTVVPIQLDDPVTGTQIMSDHRSSFLPKNVVYITGFVDLNEIYIRKVEDHNDEYDKLLNMVHEFCSFAEPIDRPLVIGEIIGAKYTLDDNFYRGKVLNQIDDTTYSIQYIDFGDKDNVPISNIFEIPIHFMTPSNIMKITLKGIESRPLNIETVNYVNSLLTNYESLIIDFSPIQYLKDVVLITVSNNENVNERINELLNNNSNISSKIMDENLPENNQIQQLDNKNVCLKNGDIVNITTFIDVHNIFVRKVEDETDEFYNFIENVNSYCSTETPIGKFPKLNDIIGAKSIDGSFYRAKVIKKVNDVSYNVLFIDYGIEENVNLSDIVPLSAEIKEFTSTIILVKLKNIKFCVLNEAALEFVTFISQNENLIVDIIEENTNEVILKTDKNIIINDHLSMLISGSIKEEDFVDSKENEEKLNLDSQIQSSVENNSVSLQTGDIVYMTAFVDFNEIYVRKLEHNNDEYYNFLEKFNDLCLSATSVNRPLMMGEIVGAKSTLDDKVYRGKILNKIDDTTYLIQYIDFGDKDNVSVSNIFEIPEVFMIPSTINKITIKGIKSCSLNAEASNYISNLLSSYEPMKIDFDPEFPLNDVTLIIIKNNENISEILNKFLKNVDNITDEISFITTQNIKDDKFYDKTNLLKNGDTVYITAYIDLNNIFVRKVEDNNEYFQKLIEEVNTFCSLGNTSESKPPELNQIVGAKSSADSRFYRARVVGKIDENKYDVVFIDFGFEENVNVADIIPLSLQLQQVMSSISLVGLKGLNFENLNLEGHKYLENLMVLNEVMKIEFEDLNAVMLTVISRNENIVDYLNELHVEDTLLDNTIVNKSLQLISGMKCISHGINIPQIPPLTNKSIVTIHAFISLTDIYITVPFNKSEMNKFLKDFSAFCLNSKPITRSPIVGEVLGIQSSINGLFNRGSVEEILTDNNYRVILFDLGTEDIVSVNHIVEIPEEFKQIPRTIYSIGLKDTYFDNLNDPAMSYVNMLCENIPLIIEFDEHSPNGLNAVTLTIVTTQQNVNNHLTTLLTEKERDSPEMVQMLNKGDIVYISSFVDLQNVYVRRINNGTDRFKSFLENFSSSCALESPIDKEPKVGEIIAAKDKTESKFFRAEVISKVDNEHFNVCFIDVGTRCTVHRSNIVQPSEKQLHECSPSTILVSLDVTNSEPIKDTVIQYINKISLTETFLINSITDQNKVTLISIVTQCNINEEIEKLINDHVEDSKLYNNEYDIGDIVNTDTDKCVIEYFKLPLEVPTQVWVAEKISSSQFLVHTYKSHIEFRHLEKQIFKDSKTFESVKSLKNNMPCIIYFSPSWYRGEILEVIDKVSAKVILIDVGNFSVIRNIKEIFCMPSKYKGKSLLMNITIQPEPQVKLAITTFKIVAKKHLDSTSIVEILESSVDQSYGDLENVGVPSFSSTPIPEDSGQFLFNSRNEPSSDPHNSSTYYPVKINSNTFTIKDMQYAKWLKGSIKKLTFLCVYQDYLIMRDHMIDDTLSDLETKIQDYCTTITASSYLPTENELCLAKYCDELWYRAICIKPSDALNEKECLVYFLDWGIEYYVNIKDISKMSKEFIYLPATAYKCYLEGFSISEWNTNTKNSISQYMLTQVDCLIVDKLSNNRYIISCDIIKNLLDLNS